MKMTEKEDQNFIERFTVRMPDGMRDAIAERAKANGRSMNSEIVQILEDALKAKVIAWDDDFLPEKEADTVIMSEKQLSKIVNIATEEALKSAVKSLSEKFEFVPKAKS